MSVRATGVRLKGRSFFFLDEEEEGAYKGGYSRKWSLVTWFPTVPAYNHPVSHIGFCLSGSSPHAAQGMEYWLRALVQAERNSCFSLNHCAMEITICFIVALWKLGMDPDMSTLSFIQGYWLVVKSLCNCRCDEDSLIKGQSRHWPGY